MDTTSLVWTYFLGVVACLAALLWGNGMQLQRGVPPTFRAFQISYLRVYLLAFAADWLQGPYLYALYEERHMTLQQISTLFLAGVLSSMVAGPVVGMAADLFGRRRLAQLFGVLYAVAACTKLSSSFWVLLVGRMLSGVATSLLFSVFETWMVAEHGIRHFPAPLLEDTFTLATLGNGLVAIAAGLLATVLVSYAGYVAPFLASASLLLTSFVVISTTWGENYGGSKSSQSLAASLRGAFNLVRRDRRVQLVGGIQSLFEGAMYVFVFSYPPVLLALDPAIPLGLVFATMMAAFMAGSSLFHLLVKRGQTPLRLLAVILLAGVGALAVPAVSGRPAVVLGAFFMFEVCCGAYFPCVGVLRSEVVENEHR